MIMLNVIQYATFAREETNVYVSLVVMTVNIYIMNYADQNTTRNTFQFRKMVTLFCHSCYKEENTDNSADEMTQVEENDDNYDSDINELYMFATQK
jgi:hypothetical protein